MEFRHYNTNDTAIIKGSAILLICLHNFFHWLPPSPVENEFLFWSDSISNLFNLLGKMPLEFVNILFSYFGHFGVQLFLLISGYGLARSMMKNERSWLPFFWERIKKLYPLLIVGVLFLFFTITLTEGRLFSDTEQTELCYKLLFIQTLVPGSALTMNGPWWFFALILQLYIFFPILYRLTKRFGWKAFLSICLISYAIIYIYKFQLGLFDGEMIMMNMPGHLPEFCLGILLATSKQPKISIIWLFAAIALFVLGNFYKYFYPLTFLAVTIITIFTYQGLKAIPIRKRILKKTLVHFGGISMAIFAVHGALRHPVLMFAAIYDNAAWHLLAGIVFLLIVWCASIAAKKIYEL
ncbi:MAG: acyltransferase, partial [Bacteroidales bacterium]|nr:acyltransferase [Bacteroidales bacterium]